MSGGWGWCVAVLASAKDEVLEMDSLWKDDMDNEAEVACG